MAGSRIIHPGFVRLTHWVNAVAVVVMIVSGWAIHNAHPTLPFEIPEFMTLSTGFITALQWHFAAMWVVMFNGLAMIGYGVMSGRYRRRLLPVSPRDVLDTVRQTLRGHLSHEDLSIYNDVQKLLYLGVLWALVIVVLTGLSIWKPVQFQFLTMLFGDFDRARLLHFCAMSVIFLFLLVHVAMALLVPRTLLAMIRGR